MHIFLAFFCASLVSHHVQCSGTCFHLCVFEVPEGGLAKFRLNCPQSESDSGGESSSMNFAKGLDLLFIEVRDSVYLQVASQVASFVHFHD